MLATMMPMEIRMVRDDMDERPKRMSTAKYPHAFEVFELWGMYPRSWASLRESRQREAAENLFLEHELEDIRGAIKFWRKHKNLPFCPSAATPFDLDTKWAKLEAFNSKL